MLRMLLSGTGSLQSALIYAASALFVIFFTLPVHEFAHALAANRLGDNTAKYQGRLTINPMAHIDYIGALMILMVGFGWAKPVPVNSRNFNNPKGGMALTAFAGPLSNLIMGFIFLLIAQAILAFAAFSQTMSYILMFLTFAAEINLSLAVFNLIPIPPLDGSKILAALLPDRIYYKFMQYERYFYIILILLMVGGALSGPLGRLVDIIFNAFFWLAGLPFGALT